eukprot:scaffold23639_cov191-Amphora_coffeaeformis.AAC.5
MKKSIKTRAKLRFLDLICSLSVNMISEDNPPTDSWSKRIGLSPSRRRASAAAVYYEPTNIIYLSHGNAGGHNEFSNALAWLDRYDVDADTWTELSDGTIPRDHPCASIVNGEICVAAVRNGRSIAERILPTES